MSQSNLPARINDRVATPRELDLIRLLAQGTHSDRVIAAKLGLTKNTVKMYLSRLYKKFNLTRYTVSMYVYRDHQRIQAIKMDQWIKKHHDGLSYEAYSEIKEILATQVLDYLNEREVPNV